MFFATESAARKSRKQRIRHEGCALVLHCASQGTKKIETDFTDPTREKAVKKTGFCRAVVQRSGLRFEVLCILRGFAVRSPEI